MFTKHFDLSNLSMNASFSLTLCDSFLISWTSICNLKHHPATVIIATACASIFNIFQHGVHEAVFLRTQVVWSFAIKNVCEWIFLFSIIFIVQDTYTYEQIYSKLITRFCVFALVVRFYFCLCCCLLLFLADSKSRFFPKRKADLSSLSIYLLKTLKMWEKVRIFSW